MATGIDKVHGYYDAVNRHLKLDIVSEATGKAIHDFAIFSLRFLERECRSISLSSLVGGKNYISYARKAQKDALSRPANVALFVQDSELVSKLWNAWWHGKINKEDLARMSYTIALAPCLALELFDRQNKKGPATYFECLIGHIFAKATGVNPHKHAAFSIAGRQVRMTMDFLFDMGAGKKGVHLPVKMSTRERVVQAWAHQRLLDAAYGKRAYRGILVCFAETKLDLKKREVVEICVPEQWFVYQSLLAVMDRIYYFDVPYRYEQLSLSFPDLISVKQFGEFFIEKEAVLAAD